MKTIIDNGNSQFKSVLKSYARNCFRVITYDFCRVIHMIYDREWLKEYINTCTNIPSINYSWHRKAYPDRLLCKLLAYEYLNDLISYDKKYIDNDELENYLNGLFDDYNI